MPPSAHPWLQANSCAATTLLFKLLSIRTPRRKTLVSRNGNSRNGNFPKQTGRNSVRPVKTLISLSISLDYASCLFETSIREPALEAIPQSKRSLKIAVPWWNKQCDIAVKNKACFNWMKRTWPLRDVIIFKRCRAKARRVILEAKSSSWQQFSTSLTSNSNLSNVWKVIKSLSGNCSSYFIPTLLAQGISAKSKQHKSNILANQFALCSSSLNYPPRFVNVIQPIQTRLLRNALSQATPIDPRLNQAFSLLSTVQVSTNTTPGPDNIGYEVFKHNVFQIIRSRATAV